MNDLPKISIIIPHYEPSRQIKQVLESISEQNYPSYLIETTVVIDNSLGKRYLQEKERFPNVRWIVNHSHIGTARAKNLGAAQAEHEWLVFLDDDLRLAPTWLFEMTKQAMLYPKTFCFQSKILFEESPLVLNGTGGVGNVFGYAWDRGVFEEDFGQYDKQEKILFASSCAMMIKKSFFKAMGGFDEDFFYMVEDFDLGLRAGFSGNEIFYVPRAVCFHQKKLNGKAESLHRKYYLERNRLLIILKNYPVFLILKILPKLFFIKVFKYFSYLIRFRKRRLQYTRDVLSGWVWIFRHWKSILQKRRDVAKLRAIRVEEIFKPFREFKYHPQNVSIPNQSKETTFPTQTSYTKIEKDTHPETVASK